ncbi:MAG: RNA 2'-phosphotransferase [Planctomycetaceae bacterium]
MTRTSQYLSLILRHNPGMIGLELDPNGWADIEALLRGAATQGRVISRELLDRVVEENSKRRFAISEDGTRIRANQGHSIDVDLQLQPRQPPAILYHGTAIRFLDSIRRTGLQPQSRQHVHLSIDQETATKVGQRHGKPAILVVEAQRMVEQGSLFYLSENEVWLTNIVPPAFITFPS